MKIRSVWPWASHRKPPIEAIEIGEPRACQRGSVWRVEAEVNGEPLWFESTDSPLDPAPEAYATALLPVAALCDARLIMAVGPDATLLANARPLLEVMHQWWGQPRDPALVSSGLAARIDVGAEIALPGKRGVGLCFSGGVDSFYSLLRGDGSVDTLVMAHGYDIPLADEVRMQAAEESLRLIAADIGIRAIIIRTNLRDHSLWRRISWARTHGGATAALGHLLRQSLGELRISASYPRVFDQPWGSHWRIDRFWSSASLQVVHVGAEKWRTEKLLEIMDESGVRRHLRVCRENRAPTGNCGRCEKCIRTMLILHAADRLEEFRVFPSALQLAENIDRLPALKQDLRPVYRGFLESARSPEVREAIDRLMHLETGWRRVLRWQSRSHRLRHGDI